LKGNAVIRLDRILVPTDFSEHAGTALQYAKALAERFDSELHLLYVMQDVVATVPAASGLLFASAGDFVVELRRDAERAMQKLVDVQELTGKGLVTEIRGGQPFLEIVRYAREMDSDLIVIGTHGRSALAHALMGSVAERVVRHGSCPVLTVRPKGHQFVMP
jgi:nucleotide-binding universal stress UspA family protein